MFFNVGAHMLMEYDDNAYHRAFNRQFTGYPKEVGFCQGLSAPQPDFVQGLEMQDFQQFPVDEQVSGAVLCKDDRRSVTLPHFAKEWKGPDGHMKKAMLQSAYDGAALSTHGARPFPTLGSRNPRAMLRSRPSLRTGLVSTSTPITPLGPPRARYKTTSINTRRPM